VRVGDVVPDFELPDETGSPRQLRDFLAEGPVVVFFYPGAMTPVCTKESCHFRDMKAEFAAVGAQRIGISHDTVAKQKQFSDKYNFDYPLLSDSENKVATMFDVHRGGMLGTKRATFVIDRDGTLIEMIRSDLRASVHADKAIEALKAHAAS
jgi:peroxiredoxin Q/BCP